MLTCCYGCRAQNQGKQQWRLHFTLRFLVGWCYLPAKWTWLSDNWKYGDIVMSQPTFDQQIFALLYLSVLFSWCKRSPLPSPGHLTVLATPCFAFVHTVHTKECPFTVNLGRSTTSNQPEEGIGIFCRCARKRWSLTKAKYNLLEVSLMQHFLRADTTSPPTL